ATLLSLRQQLITRGGANHQTFLADLGRALRRKLSLDALKSLLNDIRARLSAVPPTPKTSGSDGENERHIEPQDIKKTTPPSEPHTDLTPTTLNAICHERRSLFPEPLRQWSDVTRNADAVAPMLGITAHTLNRARQRHGPVATAIAILYMLEMHARIDHPDAYLRQLIQRTDMAQSVQEALQTGKLSADNPKTEANTIG
ncbi:MAG: replication initiation protein RepC, partial [Pseudomonadota bacterium]